MPVEIYRPHLFRVMSSHIVALQVMITDAKLVHDWLDVTLPNYIVIIHLDGCISM